MGVLTFDYRYTGLSWPPDLRHLTIGSKATRQSRLEALRAIPQEVSVLEYWGRRDTAAATRVAAKIWSGVPLVAVGHSVGGSTYQIAPILQYLSRSLR